MREADTRRRVAPGRVGRLVAIAVPAQIQTGAGTNLEDAQGQASAVRDLEETAEQRGAASDLVGLTAPREQRPDLRPVDDERLPENRPGGGRIAVAAGRRVV